MNLDFARWLLFVAGISIVACSPYSKTIAPYSKTIAMNDQGNDLRKEILMGVSLPPRCPMISGVIPAEKASFSVEYNEPSVNIDGSPLSDLAYTTVYLVSSDGITDAIRVFANDPHGGILVTIRDIPVRSETKVCITATDTHRNESVPANPH